MAHSQLAGQNSSDIYMDIFVPLIWLGSGICLFAGIQFGLFGLFSRQEKVFLAFGTMCLSLAIYMAYSAQWYHAQSLEQIEHIAVMQMAIICLVFPTFVWFLGIYSHDSGYNKILLPVSLVFGLLFIVNIFSPFSFLYDNMEFAEPIRLPWGERVNNYHTSVSQLAWLYYLATYAVFLWAIIRCVSMWRRSLKFRAATIGAYLVLQLISVIHAELIDNLGLQSVYLGEFAFLILVFLIGTTLAQEVRIRSEILEETVNELRDETGRRKEYEDQLEYIAQHDYLTDLPNRWALSQHLNSLLGRNGGDHHYGAMLLIDLDNFKLINDSLGHDIGDRILQMVAMRLKDLDFDKYIPVRLGGDEFAILYEDIEGDMLQVQETAEFNARTICEEIIKPLRIAEHELVVTASIGIAIFGENTRQQSDVMKQADMALYHAKEAGPGSVEVFAPDLKQEADRRLAINKEFRRAIENDDIEVYYQPQVDVQGNVIGAEVLARWFKSNLGEVPPREFIANAEESGLIYTLGETVLRKACQDLKLWETSGQFRLPRISVNVSPWQLDSSAFDRLVENVLADTEIEPDRLEFEITENTFLRDIKTISRRLNTLSKLGVKFSIDDFGTGYSALGWLKRLSLHELKIDKMFINGISSKGGDRLVETIIAIARQLDLRIVAEGVETPAQHEALIKMGCDCFQGYLISRPLSAENFMNWLQENYQESSKSPVIS